MIVAGPDLQRRRQRASLEAEPPGADRARGRHGPASQCPRPRPEPRLHQARSTRDPRPGPVLQHLEAAPVHRHAYHQRVASPLHDHLRRARRIRRATPGSSRSPAPSSSPRSPASSRRRRGCKPITTATSIATTPSGRPSRPRDGTARPTSACETGWRSCPRLTRTPRTRTACWPPATSCASA